MEVGTQISAQETNPLYFGGKKRRVITTGLNGQVLEWDLLSGKVLAKFSTHSAIWDSKQLNTPQNAKLMALACEDGSIKIVKIKKGAI